MPSFTFKEGCHFISYITGPAHIFLGMKFTHDAVVEPKVVKQPPRGRCSHGALDESQICDVVQEALAAFRSEGVDVYATEIVYVENDSPRYDLYSIAAYLLIKQFVNGYKFEHVV